MELPHEVLDMHEPFDHTEIDYVVLGEMAPDQHPSGDDPYAEIRNDEDRRNQIAAWVPDSIETADWAGRKFVAYTSERDEVNRVALEQIERIKAWQQAETARLDRKIGFFEGVLARYAIGRRAATKAATTKLPSVTISTRTSKGGVDVVDEEAAIEWAETHGLETAVKTTKKFLKSVLPESLLAAVAPVEVDGETVARFIDSNGEPVPGLRYREAGLSASVKANTI